MTLASMINLKTYRYVSCLLQINLAACWYDTKIALEITANSVAIGPRFYLKLFFFGINLEILFQEMNCHF